MVLRSLKDSTNTRRVWKRIHMHIHVYIYIYSGVFESMRNGNEKDSVEKKRRFHKRRDLMWKNYSFEEPETDRQRERERETEREKIIVLYLYIYKYIIYIYILYISRNISYFHAVKIFTWWIRSLKRHSCGYSRVSFYILYIYTRWHTVGVCWGIASSCCPSSSSNEVAPRPKSPATLGVRRSL